MNLLIETQEQNTQPKFDNDTYMGRILDKLKDKFKTEQDIEYLTEFASEAYELIEYAEDMGRLESEKEHIEKEDNNSSYKTQDGNIVSIKEIALVCLDSYEKI